jgi:hypothetical protein
MLLASDSKAPTAAVARVVPVITALPLEIVAVVVVIPAPALRRVESVPNDVSDEAVTPELSVAPVSDPAGAVPDTFPVTFPVKAPVKVVAVMLPVPVIVGETMVRPERVLLFIHLDVALLYFSRSLFATEVMVVLLRSWRATVLAVVEVSSHSTVVSAGAVAELTIPEGPAGPAGPAMMAFHVPDPES